MSFKILSVYLKRASGMFTVEVKLALLITSN